MTITGALLTLLLASLIIPVTRGVRLATTKAQPAVHPP